MMEEKSLGKRVSVTAGEEERVTAKGEVKASETLVLLLFLPFGVSVSLRFKHC